MSDPNCLHCALWDAFEKFVLSRERITPQDMSAEAMQAAAEIVATATPTKHFDAVRSLAIEKFTKELDDAIACIRTAGQIRPAMRRRH